MLHFAIGRPSTLLEHRPVMAGLCAEGSAVGGGGCSEFAVEVLPQYLPGGEAGAFGDGVDGEVGGFE